MLWGLRCSRASSQPREAFPAEAVSTVPPSLHGGGSIPCPALLQTLAGRPRSPGGTSTLSQRERLGPAGGTASGCGAEPGRTAAPQGERVVAGGGCADGRTAGPGVARALFSRPGKQIEDRGWRYLKNRLEMTFLTVCSSYFELPR